MESSGRFVLNVLLVFLRLSVITVQSYSLVKKKIFPTAYFTFLYILVHTASLQDYEKRFESHDNMPSRKVLYRPSLFFVKANYFTLETLYAFGLSRLPTAQAS